MAFVLPKYNKPVNQQESSADNDVFPAAPNKVSTTEGLKFLQPTKDATQDSYSDPYQEELTKKSAYQYTLKTLNALKIVSPIMSALMQRPGVDAPNEEMTDSFRRLITETSDISQAVCEKLGIDSNKERNFWIRNVLEKSFSDILHYQWVTNGKTNLEDIHKLIDTVIKFGDKVSEKSEYDEIPVETLVKLANIKAMLPILKEANEFNLYRDIEADIETIMTKLFEVSINAVEKIADEYANEKDRAKLFNIIIQEAGDLYAASWRCEGHRVLKIMKSYPPEKIKGHVEKYQATGGFPLDKVDYDFDRYFEKMLIITEKLVISQKGTIEKRLKNK